MPTIRDVAKACGVSPMTVSFVLNNKQGQVSSETRERVLKMVREMNYRPAAVERTPEAREICTLGLVAGVAGDSLTKPGYYTTIVHAVLSAADELRQNVTLFTHSLFHTDTHQSIRVYCDGRCDGLLVIAPRVGSRMVAALQERGTPFVLIGDTGDDATVSYVDVDNSEAAYRLVAYLFQQGHRRIAFVGGPDFVRSSQQRLQAYRRALEEYNVPRDRSLEALNIVYPEVIQTWVTEVMRLPASRRPTAFFAWNDGHAVYVAAALQNLGLRIPDDVSLVGFDDLEAFSVLPALTSVHQPYRSIGRRAVEALMAQIRGDADGPQRVLLQGELVFRGSVTPPPDFP